MVCLLYFQVIILTSIYSHELKDLQSKTLSLRYIASKTLPITDKSRFQNLSWLQLESKMFDHINSEEVLQVPGGGFAKCLLETLEEGKIPCVALLRFCSEGNNIPDAVDLLNYLNQWISLIPQHDNKLLAIKYPSSWKFLFGNALRSEIY